MEGTHIYEGVIKIEQVTGKVYLVLGDYVVDLNYFLAKSIGEKVKVIVGNSENL